ncbi:MAG: hypothetical protein QOJ29_1745, partial [Thermoleophilaceae bacterium]|nr:hypothetical protein [Thermoleophilaceae bacterium]
EVGGREPPSLDVLTAVLAIAFAVLCLIGVLVLRRAGNQLVVLLGIGTTTALLFHTTYTAHLATGGLPGIQGRYLYVLLVPISVLLAAAVARLSALVRLPARWLRAAVAAGAVAVALLGAALGLFVFSGRAAAGGPAAAGRFLAWAVWPPSAIVLLTAAILLVGGALVVTSSRRPKELDHERVTNLEIRVTETA